MGHPIRILLAEDHAILRDGLRSILSAEADFQVVGEAADGLAAVQRAGELKPDIVILDLSMPRMSGMDALREVKRASPGARVLILTVHRTEEYVFAALRAGADGYVLKESSSSELLLAVRSALAGERYLSPAVANKVVAGFLGSRDEEGAPQSSYEALTQREREVLKLIAEGYRSRDISEMLCISAKTVEKHRSNLMQKLGLHGVSALTAYAIERGVVSR